MSILGFWCTFRFWFFGRNGLNCHEVETDSPSLKVLGMAVVPWLGVSGLLGQRLERPRYQSRFRLESLLSRHTLQSIVFYT